VQISNGQAYYFDNTMGGGVVTLIYERGGI